MYTIEKKHYGLYVTMGGRYSPEEMKEYLMEKEQHISEVEKPFSILVDLRSALPPNEEDRTILKDSMALVRGKGLLRMAIILSSPVLGLQAKQILIDAEVDEHARIINAAKSPDWEELALNWIFYGTEPKYAEQAEAIHKSIA